jgi:glycosyltransferase involved in cell wall biosynthesis
MSHLLFVQNRAKRAGAQVSLSKIAASAEIRPLNPFVLLGSVGWLSSFFGEERIPHMIQPWPSPRSLSARVGGLAKFGKSTISQLHASGAAPTAIVANDHQECLTALALSKACGGIPVAVILRTPGMSQSDFDKYQCGKCNFIFARGETLTRRAQAWSGKEVSCMLGSFTDDDFFDPLPSCSSFPQKILIAGSEEPRKGFSDFLEALKIIESAEPNFPAIEYVFTGEKSEELSQLITQDFRSSFTFAGRVNNFQTFARQFHLAIHPSRSESFGMAPLELLLAGVPTMISRTGITDALPLSSPWVFNPMSPPELAHHLTQIWKQWPKLQLDIPSIQEHLRNHYHISQTTELLADTINDLLSD